MYLLYLYNEGLNITDTFRDCPAPFCPRRPPPLNDLALKQHRNRLSGVRECLALRKLSSPITCALCVCVRFARAASDAATTAATAAAALRRKSKDSRRYLIASSDTPFCCHIISF